jgi:hypothetical protein
MAGTQTFAVADLQTVKRRDSTAEGFFIGLGAGFVGAWGLRQQMCPNDSECAAIVTVYLGVPIVAGSAALGALIDHLNQRTLYDARAAHARVSVAPLVGRHTAGARVSMTF